MKLLGGGGCNFRGQNIRLILTVTNCTTFPRTEHLLGHETFGTKIRRVPGKLDCVVTLSWYWEGSWPLSTRDLNIILTLSSHSHPSFPPSRRPLHFTFAMLSNLSLPHLHDHCSLFRLSSSLTITSLLTRLSPFLTSSSMIHPPQCH